VTDQESCDAGTDGEFGNRDQFSEDEWRIDAPSNEATSATVPQSPITA